MSCKVSGKQYVESITGSGFDGIITILAKEKLRKGRTVCKSIFIKTFKARFTTIGARAGGQREGQLPPKKQKNEGFWAKN